MIFEHWSRATPPYSGELLSSALTRIANDHGLSGTAFTSLYWPGTRPWSVDLDRLAPDEVLDLWAHHGGIPKERLVEATLLPEQAAFGGRRPIAPMITTTVARSLPERRHALAFCPDCLAETPNVWRKAWRLAFVTICPRHGRRLHDACPACGSPMAPNRSQVFGGDRCWACWHELSDADRQPFDEPALDLQIRLLRDLEARVAVPERRLALTPTQEGDVRPGLIGCRALIAILSAPAYRGKLAGRVGLSAVEDLAGDRRQFELARLAWRHETMAILARWISPWPDRCLDLCRELGLSQRSFVRLPAGPALAALVRQLKPRFRGHITKPPAIHDRPTRRLRRRDPEGYRWRRAAKLIKIIAPGKTS
jgi:hypothetical protein